MMRITQRHVDLLVRVRDHLWTDLEACPWERADAPPHVNRVLRMLWEVSLVENRPLLAREFDRLITEAALAAAADEAD